jgi:NAD-dependent dihydropyrimidine dehydrogenase PreA subunit
MQRQIIRIDEDKCDGCAICCNGCPEGALQLVDGKARLVSETACDGLGACVGECPQDAITVELREAVAYDERTALDNIIPKGTNTLRAHLRHLHEHGQTAYLTQALAHLKELGQPIPEFREAIVHQGCPGSAPRSLLRVPLPGTARTGSSSQLGQWPIQLHLISPLNPVFHEADLLLAADCVAFALADFNQSRLPGKKLLIACPKLDHGQEVYLDKMVALLDEAKVKTIEVMIMEVPCCGGLLRLAQQAVERATRKIPIKTIVVGIDGEIRRETVV